MKGCTLDSELTYKSYGKQAVLIEWYAKIDIKTLEEILLFKEKIHLKKEGLLLDVIIGYHSLTLKYKELIADFLLEVNTLKLIYNDEVYVKKQQSFIWEIPVCYDIEFGIDLKEISIKSKLQIQDIIKLHSGNIYTVFFIGFLPGFLYLGGLAPDLYFDRKATPRLKVAKGAVAIGGQQTGVYPSESAGGWNVIGNTPITFFDVKKESPCFAKAGDKIKFTPILMDEFYEIKERVKQNTYQVSKTKIDD